jgi:hypothetical protein
LELYGVGTCTRQQACCKRSSRSRTWWWRGRQHARFRRSPFHPRRARPARRGSDRSVRKSQRVQDRQDGALLLSGRPAGRVRAGRRRVPVQGRACLPFWWRGVCTIVRLPRKWEGTVSPVFACSTSSLGRAVMHAPAPPTLAILPNPTSLERTNLHAASCPLLRHGTTS